MYILIYKVKKIKA